MRDALSPGWQTHLMFAEFDGEVIDHGDHLVVRSPQSPGYYWGNFLLYRRLPTDADFGPWMQRFDEAIVQRAPGTSHVCFGMQAEAASFSAPQAFAAAGFQHVETHPDHRRRGLCRALVHAACVHGFDRMGWHTLVLGADPHDVAIGIYRQVGFKPHDTLWMLERRAPEDRVAA